MTTLKCLLSFTLIVNTCYLLARYNKTILNVSFQSSLYCIGTLVCKLNWTADSGWGEHFWVTIVVDIHKNFSKLNLKRLPFWYLREDNKKYQRYWYLYRCSAGALAPNKLLKKNVWAVKIEKMAFYNQINSWKKLLAACHFCILSIFYKLLFRGMFHISTSHLPMIYYYGYTVLLRHKPLTNSLRNILSKNYVYKYFLCPAGLHTALTRIMQIF